MKRSGPIKPPVEPYPEPGLYPDELIDNSSHLGAVQQLTEWDDDGTLEKKNPIGFYEHKTKKKTKKRRKAK